MVATMPPHLQDRFLTATWTEQRNRHVREYTTQSGKPTISKLPGTPETPCGGEVILTDSECDDLEGFYVGECAEGSLPFYMCQPRKGSIALFRWLEAPGLSHRAPVVDTSGIVVSGIYSVPYSVAFV